MHIRVPLLIIQGRNDSRTPAHPVEIYAIKLRSLGKEIEVHWYDTGHADAGTSMEISSTYQERRLRYAYRVLGETLG